MSSSNPPFRQPPRRDPVDAMLEQWRDIKAEDRRKDPLPPMAQLELMILLLKRP